MIRRTERLLRAEGCTRLVLPMQNNRIVVARTAKAWCELETAHQEMLCIGVPAEPAGDFRQHANRRDVGGGTFQVPAQQVLRPGNIISSKRARG